MQVRAAVLSEPSGPFEIAAELTLGDPRRSEVLVRVIAAGVCAIDLHVRDGQVPVPLPAVLGHEGAWVVERLDAGRVRPRTGRPRGAVVSFVRNLPGLPDTRIGRCALAGAAEAERAAAAAKAAFGRDGWKDDRRLRARVPNRLAERLEARADDLVRLLGRENGKVAAHARLEVGVVPDTPRLDAAFALTGTVRDAERAPAQPSVVLREPSGVAGIIAPLNSPAAPVVRSLAPALAAGCTAAVMLPAQTAEVKALVAGGRAALSDQFEEGGFKQSGPGRMRGSAVPDDFLEHRHLASVPAAAEGVVA